MCDIVGQAVRAGVSRRNVLRATLGGAAVLGVAACSGNTGPAANQPSAAGTPAPAGPPSAEGARTQLILLGTSGGPPYWPGSDREGIASALLVGDRYYVVDAGAGVLRQMRSAQLGNWQHDTDGPLDAMRAIFLTHLHSDHVVDLNNLLTEGLYNGLAKVDRKVQIWGPGNIGPIAKRNTGPWRRAQCSSVRCRRVLRSCSAFPAPGTPRGPGSSAIARRVGRCSTAVTSHNVPRCRAAVNH